MKAFFWNSEFFNHECVGKRVKKYFNLHFISDFIGIGGRRPPIPLYSRTSLPWNFQVCSYRQKCIKNWSKYAHMEERHMYILAPIFDTFNSYSWYIQLQFLIHFKYAYVHSSSNFWYISNMHMYILAPIYVFDTYDSYFWYISNVYMNLLAPIFDTFFSYISSILYFSSKFWRFFQYTIF